jgi:hypothetical protein
MPLAWNEIRDRAYAFAKEWQDESREHAEAKSFWDDFFQVFGVRRRTVASFEEPVRTLKETYGFIDLFWKGMLLAEHKSRGKSLAKAQAQAMEYIQDLKTQGRDSEIPRYVALSDFARIALHDLEENRSVEFALSEFPEHIRDFAFVPGYKTHVFADQDPINLRAVSIIGDLHDTLEAGGYSGHDLERLLVRVLFCLFAEDSGIFERNTFELYLRNRTAEDGSDLGMHLARLFAVLDTPIPDRQAKLDEDLATLPYVNGDLFGERLGFADFNRDMRNALLACCRFDWSRISPAVFGSLFQSVMEPVARRKIGGHYTSERDILKVIRALFLDDLRADFQRVRRDAKRLLAFHERLGTLRFLDPACGCGNFLVITYRELRQLELEVLRARFSRGELFTDVTVQMRVDVDQFYGIEIQEWPTRIAEVSLWLMDHQMNQRVSSEFGEYVTRLPLQKSPTIVHANALRTDWNKVLPVERCSFVLGNPPFVGGKYQSAEQRADMKLVTRGVANAGLLDYVTAWYFVAAEYVRGTTVPVAFVSTNSISQGEQVGVLWNELLRRNCRIHFAHRTFQWESEAQGKAHVHVVIIGFGTFDRTPKRLWDYEIGTGAVESTPRNISPYLIEGGNTVVLNRSRPLCDVPAIGIGNKPIDGGQYLFTPEEMEEFLDLEPNAEPYFRRWIGAKEFINGIERWCLWLGDCPPKVLRGMPHAMKRVAAVRRQRLASRSAGTQAIASTPTRFHVENMPTTEYLAIPKVSSIRRRYIPMAFTSPDVLGSDLIFIVETKDRFHFGVLTSMMHMAWMRHIGGRLKSDYRYSNKLVYNNFPWPQDVSDKTRGDVVDKAQLVLRTRREFRSTTLADLYGPLSMPAKLARAHTKLDRAVERCYRSQPFPHDRNRMEFLFDLYERLANPLTASPKRGSRPK